MIPAFRSPAQQQACIEQIIDHKMMSYSLNGRETKRMHVQIEWTQQNNSSSNHAEKYTWEPLFQIHRHDPSKVEEYCDFKHISLSEIMDDSNDSYQAQKHKKGAGKEMSKALGKLNKSGIEKQQSKNKQNSRDNQFVENSVINYHAQKNMTTTEKNKQKRMKKFHDTEKKIEQQKKANQVSGCSNLFNDSLKAKKPVDDEPFVFPGEVPFGESVPPLRGSTAEESLDAYNLQQHQVNGTDLSRVQAEPLKTCEIIADKLVQDSPDPWQKYTTPAAEEVKANDTVAVQQLQQQELYGMEPEDEFMEGDEPMLELNITTVAMPEAGQNGNFVEKAEEQDIRNDSHFSIIQSPPNNINNFSVNDESMLLGDDFQSKMMQELQTNDALLKNQPSQIALGFASASQNTPDSSAAKDCPMHSHSDQVALSAVSMKGQQNTGDHTMHVDHQQQQFQPANNLWLGSNDLLIGNDLNVSVCESVKDFQKAQKQQKKKEIEKKINSSSLSSTKNVQISSNFNAPLHQSPLQFNQSDAHLTVLNQSEERLKNLNPQYLSPPGSTLPHGKLLVNGDQSLFKKFIDSQFAQGVQSRANELDNVVEYYNDIQTAKDCGDAECLGDIFLHTPKDILAVNIEQPNQQNQVQQDLQYLIRWEQSETGKYLLPTWVQSEMFVEMAGAKLIIKFYEQQLRKSFRAQELISQVKPETQIHQDNMNESTVNKDKQDQTMNTQ